MLSVCSEAFLQPTQPSSDKIGSSSNSKVSQKGPLKKKSFKRCCYTDNIHTTEMYYAKTKITLGCFRYTGSCKPHSLQAVNNRQTVFTGCNIRCCTHLSNSVKLKSATSQPNTTTLTIFWLTLAVTQSTYIYIYIAKLSFMAQGKTAAGTVYHKRFPYSELFSSVNNEAAAALPITQQASFYFVSSSHIS